MTTTATIRALLDRLPDDCTLDDVQYHLYVAQAVARGVADEREGQTTPQAQVEAEMRRKWLTGSAQCEISITSRVVEIDASGGTSQRAHHLPRPRPSRMR